MIEHPRVVQHGRREGPSPANRAAPIADAGARTGSDRENLAPETKTFDDDRSIDADATSHDTPLPELVANHACGHTGPETPNRGVTPIMAAMAGARNVPRSRFRLGFGGIAGDRSPPRRLGQLPTLPATAPFECAEPRKRTVPRHEETAANVVASRNARES